jgi:hypothetical protein
MKFLVKADQYAFRLYRPGGELPETLPEHRVDGHRCIGHYASVTSLLRGARNHLAKLRSTKATALDALLMREQKNRAEDLRIIQEVARQAAVQLPKAPRTDLIA